MECGVIGSDDELICRNKLRFKPKIKMVGLIHLAQRNLEVGSPLPENVLINCVKMSADNLGICVLFTILTNIQAVCNIV